MNEQQIETLKSLIDTDNALLPAFAEQIKDEALTKLYDGLMQNRPNIVRSRSDSQWVSSNSDIADILCEIAARNSGNLLTCSLAGKLIPDAFPANCPRPK